MLDGNRRWARAAGFDVSHGHRRGRPARSPTCCSGAAEVGIEHVTLFLLSTDNFASRDDDELAALLEIITDVVDNLAGPTTPWRVIPVGALDLLPPRPGRGAEVGGRAHRRPPGLTVNVAVGYGGRQEIADAVRSLLQARAAAGETLEQVADDLDVEHIAEHLYTKGQPDPDLVIRTSGEQRLSGLPALAVGALGVLLHRRAVAGLPQDRLPAGAARLRRPATPLRRLTPSAGLRPTVNLRWRLRFPSMASA